MIRVHYPNPPSPEVLAALRSELGEAASISTGETTKPYEILIDGRPTEVQIAGPDLSAVIIPFAGPSAATLDLLRSRPELTVCNLHHNAPDTAELAVALLLAAAKEIVPMDQKLRAFDWTPRYLPTNTISLDGKRALILGYGHIGSRISHALLGLGMEVHAVKRRIESAHVEGGVQLHHSTALHELLPLSQVLMIALPETSETNGLIGSRELGELPKGAILVNIARGGIVDEGALFLALQSKHLHSAGLDVWYSYPQGGVTYHPIPDSATDTRPSKFQFETLENVVMSPHRGGVSLDIEARRVRDLAIILRALAGNETAPNQMNLQAGY